MGEDIEPKLFDNKGEDNGKEDEDKVESEGSAEARAAARSMREDHMDSGAPCGLVEEDGEKVVPQGRKLYISAIGSVGSAQRSMLVAYVL